MEQKRLPDRRDTVVGGDARGDEEDGQDRPEGRKYPQQAPPRIVVDRGARRAAAAVRDEWPVEEEPGDQKEDRDADAQAAEKT
jgi:hypothetical protein